MSDDIVTRLRLRPTILRKNQFGDMETDRAATALFNDCHAIMREAADEIERLRVQALGTQRRIQDQDAIMAELWERIHAFTAERDEARREICERIAAYAPSMSAAQLARERGWDCFDVGVIDGKP